MEVTELKRSFVYKGITLPDTSSAMAPAEVKDFYGATYPELVNAEIEGPVRNGGADVYTFRKAVGTKGAESVPPVTVYAFTREELVAAFMRWDGLMSCTPAESDAHWANRPLRERSEAAADHLLKALGE